MNKITSKQLTIDEIFLKELNREIEVRGQCMQFLIQEKDTIIVSRTKPEMLTIGDIVLFQKDDLFVIHRIIYKRQINGSYTFLTKGDVHPSFDSPVEENQIMGKVITIKKPVIGPIDLDTSQGKLLSCLVCLYSMLFYPVNKIIKQISNLPFTIISKIVSLFHQISNQFISVNPKKFLSLNKKFNQFAAGLIHLVNQPNMQKKWSWLRLFETIPKLFFIIRVYYFTKKSDHEKKQMMTEHYNSSRKITDYVNWSKNGLNELEEKLIEKYFTSQKKILVIGGATGREAFALARKRFKVTVIDSAEKMVEKARQLAKKERNLDVEFKVMDAGKLDFSKNTFDYVTMFNSFQINPRNNRIKALEEVSRTIKVGGYLILWSYHHSKFFLYLILRSQFHGMKWMAEIIDLFVSVFIDLPRSFFRCILKDRYKGLEPRERFVTHTFMQFFSKRQLAKEIEINGWEIIELCSKYVLPLVDCYLNRVKMDFCVAKKISDE